MKTLLKSIRKPPNLLKKVNRSPRNLLSQIKSFEKTKKTLPSLPPMNIKDLQQVKNKLKKTNNAVKKKSPEKGFIEQALIKKFKNIKKKSSSDSDNWSS